MNELRVIINDITYKSVPETINSTCQDCDFINLDKNCENTLCSGTNIHGKKLSWYWIKTKINTGLQDSSGQDIYDGDTVYIVGYGEYIAKFPYLELYKNLEIKINEQTNSESNINI